MSLQTVPRTQRWLHAGRMVPAAFVGQALVSLVGWFVVNDRSHGFEWSNTDFKEWALLSALCGAVAVVIVGVASRRGMAALAIAAGCFLAVVAGCAVFVGYAVFHGG